MKKGKFQAYLFLAVMPLVFAGSVQATDEVVDPGPNVESFNQLDVLRSQNAVLAETVKNKELRAKIKDGEDNKTSGQYNPETLSSAARQPSFSSSPQVQMVSGVGNHLTAVIVLPNGGQVAARVGTTIPGVGQVKNISLNEVTVANKQQVINLPFVGDAVSPTPAVATGAQMMPTIPPQGMIPGGGR